MNDAVIEQPKAYDVKILVAKLKENGLEIAEESAKGVFMSVIEWVEESAPLSATPYDDMALIVLPPLKKFAMEQFEKINKED